MATGRKPVLTEKRKVRTECDLEKEINDALIKLAEKRGVRRINIVEQALREYLERHKDELEEPKK